MAKVSFRVYNKEIENLSLGGISIIYEHIGNPLSEVFEVDIRVGDFFRLGRVRVKTKSDSELVEFKTESRIIKRLNGRFINMNVIQEYELEKFLRKYGNKV